MKWIACLLLVAGCQHGEGEAPKQSVTEKYRNDIASICDVIHLADADKLAKNERAPIIAMWLGPHIQTDEARDFLAGVQPLTGEAKAQAFEAEARRVGLSSCALANEWRP
ncbi:MAG: mucin-associated surface protein [Myxococcales bacterium]|nr:mucin-associated surface protein [Myxococcales bacterium]